MIHPCRTDWALTTIRMGDDLFANRAHLPAAWAGLTDAALEVARGVARAKFCRNGWFIAVAENRVAVLKMPISRWLRHWLAPDSFDQNHYTCRNLHIILKQLCKNNDAPIRIATISRLLSLDFTVGADWTKRRSAALAPSRGVQDHLASVLLRLHLRSRRDDAVHAVPPQTPETANCPERRGGG